MAVRVIKTAHPLFEAAQQKWKSSGITDEQARTLKLTPLSGDEVQQVLHTDRQQPGGMLIPYFDMKGKPTEFFRIRYLEPIPGFAGMVEKPQRYVQPAKTLNEAYLPPLLDAEWQEIAEDTNAPIYITEGELKAASAAGAGLACIGLGGVDVWRSSKRGVALLPQLEAIDWKNRTVVIVYDSDAATNANVVRAQDQLARELLSRGAMPAVASIPPGAEGRKQGLDDLIVAEGAEALTKILEHAPAHQEAGALWTLNTEVAFVREGGIVIERSTGRRMDPGKFISSHYANRHYVQNEIVKGGAISAKKKPLARRWMEWERRYEVDRIVYEPGKPQIYDGCWNSWPGWGVEPKKGDVSQWKWLLDFLFRGESEAQQWFERWCAYPLQYPGTKLYTASLLWSVKHGMGKGLVEYMLKSIYGRNGIEIDSDALRASFNAWAENKQFVIGNEITAGEARLDKDKLKGLITRPEIRINQKFLPEYVIRDCVNYIFDSNSPDALFLEDNDRRYFVHEVKGDPASQEFYDRCDAFLKGPGPSHLFHHLLHLDLGAFHPRERAPNTVSKQAMILTGKSDVGMWCQEVKEDPTTRLLPLGERAAKECDLYTPSQLLKAYDPDRRTRVSAPGMAREMLRGGLRQMNGASPVRTKVGVLRLYAVRNADKWIGASPRALADHYERYFGPI